MKRILVALFIIWMMCVVASAQDRDVQAVVSAIEQRYGLRHRGLPWIAKPFIKTAGAGMSIELFEDQRLPDSASLKELDDLTSGALGGGWRSFIRVDSRRDHERTLIYAKPEGRHMLLLIVAADAHETTVLKMKLGGTETKNWLENPEHESEQRSGHKRESGSSRD